MKIKLKKITQSLYYYIFKLKNIKKETLLFINGCKKHCYKWRRTYNI